MRVVLNSLDASCAFGIDLTLARRGWGVTAVAGGATAVSSIKGCNYFGIIWDIRLQPTRGKCWDRIRRRSAGSVRCDLPFKKRWRSLQRPSVSCSLWNVYRPGIATGEAARRAETSSSSEDCLNCLEITDQRLGAWSQLLSGICKFCNG